MDAHFLGEPETTEPDLLDEWKDLDLDRDAWLIELDGKLAGYAALYTGAHTYIDGYVHPRFFARGVGSRLAELAEVEASKRALKKIQNAALGNDDRARELLTSRGYHELRRFYRMALELPNPPKPPEWPPGFHAEPLDYAKDADAFHATLDEAFAEEFGHEPERGIDWRARRERHGFDPTFWFVVKHEDEVAAAVLCEENRFGGGWVASIGVLKPYRKRGLGRALLQHAFQELYRRGWRRVSLGVDAENPTGATRLYERVGLHQVFEAIVYEKPLSL
jgi:mycothiol synthase